VPSAKARQWVLTFCGIEYIILTRVAGQGNFIYTVPFKHNRTLSHVKTLQGIIQRQSKRKKYYVNKKNTKYDGESINSKAAANKCFEACFN